MNYYLQVLGLDPGVSEQEIKQAYRKLVKKYHPDVNKNPDASQKFIEISEAYKFLIDVGGKPHQEKIPFDYNPYDQEYDEWRRKAREFARKRREEAEADYRKTLMKIFSFYDYFAGFALVINLLWAIDYFLPPRESEKKLLFVERYFESSRGQKARYAYDVLYFENHSVKIEKGATTDYEQLNNNVFIITTPIFANILKVRFSATDHKAEFFPVFSLYKIFWFFIPLIFLLSFIYFKRARLLEDKFVWAFLLLMVFIFQLLLL